MTAKGRELYSQVEEALRTFKLDVAELRSHLAETETILAESGNTLTNLKRETKTIAGIREEAQTQLAILDKHRQDQAKDTAKIHSFVQAELKEQSRVLADYHKEIIDVRRGLTALLEDYTMQTKKQFTPLIGAVTKLREEFADLEKELTFCQTREKALARSIKGLTGLVIALFIYLVLAGLVFLLT